MEQKQQSDTVLPLAGIKVLDISQFVAGPGAAAILADFGADVIKVEHPVRGDTWRGYVGKSLYPVKEKNFLFEQDNRNKRAITLDLTKKAGQQVVHRLIAQVDVLITNLRAHELERYDLEYQSLATKNPRLIYGNITGYGLVGPECGKPGFDYTAYWARAGFQSVLKEPDRPPVMPRSGMGDHVGSLSLAGGISLALYHRERTGMGQEVIVSLLNSGMWSLSDDIMAALTQDMFMPPAPTSERLAMVNTYRTKDDKWIMMIHLTPDVYWPAFCKALGLGHLEKDGRFTDYMVRRDNNGVLLPMVEAAMLSKTSAEWTAIFDEYGLIYSPVQDPMDLTRDQQAWATGCYLSMEHPVHGPFHWVNNPFGLKGTPATIRSAAPEFGQHTEEVLQEAGLTWEEIITLKDEGVIA